MKDRLCYMEVSKRNFYYNSGMNQTFSGFYSFELPSPWVTEWKYNAT